MPAARGAAAAAPSAHDIPTPPHEATVPAGVTIRRTCEIPATRVRVSPAPSLGPQSTPPAPSSASAATPQPSRSLACVLMKRRRNAARPSRLEPPTDGRRTTAQVCRAYEIGKICQVGTRFSPARLGGEKQTNSAETAQKTSEKKKMAYTVRNTTRALGGRIPRRAPSKMRARTSPKTDRRSPARPRRSGEEDASRRVSSVVGAPEDSGAPRRASSTRATPEKSRVAFGSSSSQTPSPKGKENKTGGSRSPAHSRVTPSRSAEQMRRVEAACARAGVASPVERRRSVERAEGLLGSSGERERPPSPRVPDAWSPSSEEDPVVTPQSGPRELVKAPQPSPRVMPSQMLRSAVEAAAEASAAAEAASDASFEEADRRFSPPEKSEKNTDAAYVPPPPRPLAQHPGVPRRGGP